MTGTDLWRKAEALLPKLKERAPKCEQLRRLPDETLRDFHDAQLFRIHQPKRVGGAELEFAAVVTYGALFARVCASTAWNWVNFAAHHMMLGMFPPQAQDQIWGKSRDALIASSFVFPAGKARKVQDGYLLSGRWPFSSGVDPSEWNMLAGLARLDDNLPPEQRIFLVPRSEYKVLDTWHAGGLRGTGSNDVVVDNAFVPGHRALSFTGVTKIACPGHQVNPGPLYRIPFGSIFSYAITTPIIGMATGAYAAHVDYQRQRVRASYVGQRSAEDPFAQVRIAEAAALIDAAWLALERDMTELMGLATSNEKIPLPLRLRTRRDQVTGTGQAIRAVDLLFENSGGRALKLGTPIQRFWRDAHAGRVHAINDPERALSTFGRGELGHDMPPDAMF